MEIKDVIQCSFDNWYHSFKNVTPVSIILPLPDGFVEYLKSDGLILPETADFVCKLGHNGSSSSDEEDWEDSEPSAPEAPNFVEFDTKIKNSIKQLGGKVFPKLNWSSPRDASWIALNNCCCCSTLTDIYLLLKSSDFIMHDITQPFLRCSDYDSTKVNIVNSFCLVLREWVEINPDTEFRCFVKSNILIGITQRDLSSYSEYNKSQKNQIIRDIVNFFTENIQFRFPSVNYVFDIVRRAEDDVFLLDFNPFGDITDSLLFAWSELHGETITAGVKCLPEYRCITQDRGIQPRPFNYYAVPKDIVDITTGEDSFKFADLLKLRLGEQISNDDTSDCDEG